MKKLILLAVLPWVAGLTLQAKALTFAVGFDNGGNILDGNVNPWSDTRAIGGTGGLAITEVSVRLNISGGYNGDLYAYLSYNGILVPLLNRAGVGSSDAFGYADGGLNVTFTDTAAENIHFYQSVSGYSISGAATWRPDGRTINPVSAPPPDFDAAGTGSLASYDGMIADGEWTLALADLSGGGGQSRVASWGLDITTVPGPGPGPEPEPVPDQGATGPATAVSLGLILGVALWKGRRIAMGPPQRRWDML